MKDNNMLTKVVLYKVVALTVIWFILKEEFTLSSALAGVIIGFCCVFFYYMLFPFPRIRGLNLFRLFVYIFYLMGQVYIGGFISIKRFLKGADVDIIQIKTKLSNDFLKTVLANSMTLIPGSISLDLTDDTFTMLRFKKKNDDADMEKAGEALKGKLERLLLKVEE